MPDSAMAHDRLRAGAEVTPAAVRIAESTLTGKVAIRYYETFIHWKPTHCKKPDFCAFAKWMLVLCTCLFVCCCNPIHTCTRLA